MQWTRRCARACVGAAAVVSILILTGTSQALASEADGTASTPLGTNVFRIPTTEKVCVLSFDDALNTTYVKRVLATLQANGVTATFFPTGASIESHPELVKEIIAAGCDIGSHTYTHAWMTRLSTTSMRSQIQMTEMALSKIGIKDAAPLFRAPYGAWNSKLLSVLGNEGYVNVMWSSTAGDTAPGGVSASRAIANVLTNLRPGAIILMHITHKSTPDAMPELIRQIKARGYRIVSLREALFDAEHREARYQQVCPQLAYMGTWQNYVSQAASGGSRYKGISKGAAVMAGFTGTTFELISYKGPDYGKALVSIDGGEPIELDLYYPWGTSRHRVLRVTGLSDGTHTALIWAPGTKNPASRGYQIDVDAMKVSGWLVSPPPLTRHQENETVFSYVGPWSASQTWSASGGEYKWASAPGAAVNVTFDGTYLAWVGKKGPDYGKALVSLDGGTPFLVDLYHSSNKYKVRIYDTGILPDGPHTLSIYWNPQKNPVSRGYRIDVDTFDFFGTPTEAPAPPPITWRYQETDLRLVYLGDWTVGRTWSASGGSFRGSEQPGAAVLMEFEGTSVELLARTAPWCGKALISVDGGPAETVDFYTAGVVYKNPVWSKEGLGEGTHTLVVECAGEKSEASLGIGINLDALDILGTMTQAPAPTRYQQDDAAVVYSGDWLSSNTDWSYSGGTCAYTDQEGAKLTVQFQGTYLAWVSKMAPWYGVAEVSLDGGAPVRVDLYSSSVRYKQQVYNTGLLDEGPHTLVIGFTGAKGPDAWSSTVAVDAFDVMGTLLTPGA